MTNYTPIPLHGDTHIPEYGLHGPMVDGLLAARKIVSDIDAQSVGVECAQIASRIDRLISDVKVTQAKLVREWDHWKS